MLSKVLEIIPCSNYPFLERTRLTRSAANCLGISCTDATFATQEILTNHLREDGQPYLCLFDIEKVFDSVELPILLQHLYDIGINGKFWRLIKNWYTNSNSHVRIHNQHSEPFTVERGVEQGSILSPTPFLTVIDHYCFRNRDSEFPG